MFRQLMAPSGRLLALESFDQLPGADVFGTGLGGVVTPLPSEPLGVGARWESVGSVVISGIEWIQTATVDVLEIDGPRLSIEMAVTQEIGPDGLALPGLENADVDAEIGSTGSGSAVWDLDAVFPPQARSEATQTVLATITAGGETVTLDQSTTITFEISGE